MAVHTFKDALVEPRMMRGNRNLIYCGAARCAFAGADYFLRHIATRLIEQDYYQASRRRQQSTLDRNDTNDTLRDINASLKHRFCSTTFAKRDAFDHTVARNCVVEGPALQPISPACLSELAVHRCKTRASIHSHPATTGMIGDKRNSQWPQLLAKQKCRRPRC
jgi:hypothetical protein